MIKKKKVVKIKEARRFKDHLGVMLEDEEGKAFMTVNVTNGDASLNEIKEAVKRECYMELGESVPAFKGKEIEVEYEEKNEE